MIEGYLVRASLEYNDILSSIAFKVVHDGKHSIYSIFENNVSSYDLDEELNQLLQEVTNSSFDGTIELFDANSSNSWWAITNGDIILKPLDFNTNSEIYISKDVLLNDYPYVEGEEVATEFTDIKLMNNGTVIVATICNTMAQSGNIGLYTYNIETKEETIYKDVFGSMVAFVNYYDDTTIIAHSMEHITFIDLETFEKNVIDFNSISYNTNDYDSYYTVVNENEIGFLYKGYFDTDKKELLYQFDKRVYIAAVLNDYLILRIDNNYYAFGI